MKFNVAVIDEGIAVVAVDNDAAVDKDVVVVDKDEKTCYSSAVVGVWWYGLFGLCK